MAGREGVGKVIEVGEKVGEEVMNKVVAIPDEVGAWQEYCDVKVDDLLLLPALVPYSQLSVGLLNPMTAWRLLNDFEYLREGDVIIQNAGNSAVGLAVIQFAKRMGGDVHFLSQNRGKSRGLESIWCGESVFGQ